MKKYFLFTFFFFAAASFISGQPKYTFDNEYALWRGRTDYFNWKVFIKADSAWLASVKQVEYYLDPTYKTSKRIVTKITGGKNFTLCCNGWGEFILRVKIVFINSRTPSINETYKLDLKSPAKKSRNYRCP